MADRVYYLTTPIYYVNDAPHIGHFSTTVAADVVARFQRLCGRRVLFATGTDEHAPKVAEAARQRGKAPQEFVDEIVATYLDTWRETHISYDDFIRTTEPRHKEVVRRVFERLRDQGDIYKGIYEGWYCVPDETFWQESDLVDGRCPNPECRRPVQKVREENWFFRLSAYQDRLLKLYQTHPEILGPDFRRNEVLSFIRAGLRDASITRSAYGWGIPVPGEPDKVIYVWFDALLNYITVAGYLQDEEKLQEVWPADLHLMAKDIFVRFHATLWPAILMGLGLPVPRRIFAHGFWTVDGEKISKSKGNAINPRQLAADVAARSGSRYEVVVDALRFFIFREVPFGMDGDFSTAGFVQRFNSDLANDLGNLVNRSLAMLHRYFDGRVPEAAVDPGVEASAAPLVRDVGRAIEELRFNAALESIWSFVGALNKYLDAQAPWRLAREARNDDLARVMYSVLDGVRRLAVALAPFMPVAAAEIWRQLGIADPLERQLWSEAMQPARLAAGTRVGEPEPIFRRIDEKRPAAKEKSVETPVPASPAEKPAPPEKPVVTFDEFKRLDLRVCRIETAEPIPGANKLLKLTVNTGTDTRTVVAGIAQYYAPESLVGRKIVLICNLAPARIRGVESQGMLLAADQDGRAVLLQPEQDVPVGSVVR
ncbi:MAG: methionine--tRNA ligase [Armatimonadota bacterium]|nr:methionine--tRNA ligase [Armatimonadota bacterium]